METKEFQNIWKNFESEFSLKSTEELNQILTIKTRKTINKFLLFISIDIFLCIGLSVFLIMTAINRISDIIYLVNNTILCLITLTALIISILSWNKLHNNKSNLSLKDWLEQRIKLLSVWLMGKFSKLYMVIIPLLLVMMNLSIHVYFENQPFIEVIKNEESIYGLVIAFLVGLLASYFALNKIAKYQIRNLDFLKGVYSHLDNMHEGGV